MDNEFDSENESTQTLPTEICVSKPFNKYPHLIS